MKSGPLTATARRVQHAEQRTGYGAPAAASHNEEETGVSFTLTEEQLQVRDLVRRVARERVAPRAAAIALSPRVPISRTVRAAVRPTKPPPGPGDEPC